MSSKKDRKLIKELGLPNPSAVNVDSSFMERVIRAAGVGFNTHNNARFFSVRWIGGHPRLGYAQEKYTPSKRRRTLHPCHPRISVPRRELVPAENWNANLAHELVHAIGVLTQRIRAIRPQIVMSEERVAEYGAEALCALLGYPFPRWYIDTLGPCSEEEQEEILRRLAVIQEVIQRVNLGEEHA